MDTTILEQIINYIDKVFEVVAMSETRITKLEEFSQVVGKMAIDAVEISKNTFNFASTTYEKLISHISLLYESNIIILDLIDLLTKLSISSIIIGTLNSIVMIILAIYVVKLNKKIKELE